MNLKYTLVNMKHLKRFNESKVLDKSVIDECKDILLELEDIGFKTNIHPYFTSGVGKEHNKQNLLTHRRKPLWIQFYFTRKEDFGYSDIEDVVERLKSYLSEYNLHIQWQSPKERSEQRPTIKTTRVMNPMTFEAEGIKTQCELHFN